MWQLVSRLLGASCLFLPFLHSLALILCGGDPQAGEVFTRQAPHPLFEYQVLRESTGRRALRRHGRTCRRGCRVCRLPTPATPASALPFTTRMHVVTGRPHHLSPPWQSSLRRVQLCCCCSWTSWTTADGRVRRATVRRRREAELVTAAMHIGYEALKVRALHAHALRHTPCCEPCLPSRPPASQTSCFWLTACFARRPGAAPKFPRPASSSSARTSPF